MNEQQLSEKLSHFLSKSEKYKTMVKPSIRTRLQRVGEILGGEAGAFTVGAIGSAVLSAAGLASGIGILVTIPLFCIGTMFGYAFTLGIGKSMEYGFKHFDPNDPVRQKHLTKTIEIIQKLQKKNMSPPMQSSLEQAVKLLTDKELPPAFWSELNPVLEEAHNWYKKNYTLQFKNQQFDAQVSEFQRRFDLSKQQPSESNKQPTVSIEDKPVAPFSSSDYTPTIIKL